MKHSVYETLKIKIETVSNVTPIVLAVLALELAPAAAFGFAGEAATRVINRWPAIIRLMAPVVFVLPYVLIAAAQHIFEWKWFALYAILPPLMAWLLMQASVIDPDQRGNWRDAVILLTLGLAVDLRWFESAWPRGWESLGKILLVDAGLYAFLAIRKLTGAGFDLRLHWTDWKTGLRELAFFAPLVITLGMALGFIQPHAATPRPLIAILRWVAIFFFVALPEELFFRGWVQNFLERHLGRTPALVVASILFGLSHFNKRSAHFNWRYVLLATIAGIFYGRAWRDRHRLAASTITHAFVDWLWSWWF